MSDNNIDPVIMCWWLRWRKKRGNGKRKHWVDPFFHDNLDCAPIVSEKLNQDPELFKSFYRMSTESFSLLVDLVGPEVPTIVLVALKTSLLYQGRTLRWCNNLIKISFNKWD
jgi:hypothetical protein